MKIASGVPQLYLRMVLGVGFIIPVADRMGWLGPPGQKAISWGDWANFITYTNTLMPFLNRSMSNVMGLLATAAEILIGVFLLIGYKTRIAALGCFILTLIFAVCMAAFLGIKAPFTYSVFSDSAASLLLATISSHSWSFDNYVSSKFNRQFFF